MFGVSRRVVAITIPAAKVGSGGVANFPILITEANLPAEMFQWGSGYGAQADGGDIVFYSDETGLNRLPCEIVTWTPDPDPDLCKAEIWVSVPALSSAGDTIIYCGYRAAVPMVPEADDGAYGRNAAWSEAGAGNYRTVIHDPMLRVDSSGSTTDWTRLAGYTMTAMDGKIGGGANFGATYGSAIYHADTAPVRLAANADFTTSAWVKRANYSESSGSCLLSKWRYNGAAGEGWMLQLKDSGQLIFYMDLNGATVNSAYPDDTNWHHVVCVKLGSKAYIYVDGALINAGGTTIGAGVSTHTVSTEPIAFGDFNSQAYLAGTYHEYKSCADELRLANAARNAAWITTTYNNESDPATFATPGTPADNDPLLIAATGQYSIESTPLSFSPVTHPAALYAASADKSFMAFQDNTGCYPYLAVYNHATESWGTPIQISTTHLTADDHGCVSLAADSTGRLFAFYASHCSTQYFKFTAVAYNTASWSSEYHLTGDISYPCPFFGPETSETEADSLFLMYGKGSSSLTNRQWCMRKWTSESTWGDETVIVDVLDPTHTTETDGAVYAAVQFDPITETIHLFWHYVCYVSVGVNTLSYICYAKSTDYGATWTKSDGTAYTLPISFANAEKLMGGTKTDSDVIAGAITIDADGNPAIVWPYNGYMTFLRHDGTAWQTAVQIVATDNIFDVATMILESDGTYRAFITVGTGRGGELWEYCSADGINFVYVQTISTGTVGTALRVENRSADHQVEIVYCGGTGVYDVRSYGDRSYVNDIQSSLQQQYAYDAAAVLASAASIKDGATILGQAGTYPTTATTQAADAATLTATTLDATGDDTTVTFGASEGTAKSGAVYAAGETAGEAAQYAADQDAVEAVADQILSGATLLGVEGTGEAGGGTTNLTIKGDDMGTTIGQTRVTLTSTSTPLATLLASAQNSGGVKAISEYIKAVTLKADASGGYWQLGGEATTSSDPIPTGGITVAVNKDQAETIQLVGSGMVTVYQVGA